jgi:hypothetical protein
MKTTKFNFKKLSFNRFYESVRDTVKLFSLLMPLRQMAPRDLEASLFRHLKKQNLSPTINVSVLRSLLTFLTFNLP